MTNKQILEKWKPIIVEFFPNISDMKMNMMCKYADHHTNKTTYQSLLTENNINTLPISLKILDKLNLDNIDVEICNPNSKCFIDTLEMSFSNKNGIKFELFNKMEILIIEETASTINKLLENKKSICIDMILSSVSYIKERDWDGKVFIKSRYNIR